MQSEVILPRGAMHSADCCGKMSVRPSVWHTPVMCQNGETNHQTFSLSGSSHSILVFFLIKRYGNIPTGAPNRGVECKGGMKKSRFATNISLCLGNDTRYNHSYYGMRIENHTQAFEWYHFEWPWTIPNPDFKVTPLLDADYLRNGTSYIFTIEYKRDLHAHAYSSVISNDLEWS